MTVNSWVPMVRRLTAEWSGQSQSLSWDQLRINTGIQENFVDWNDSPFIHWSLASSCGSEYRSLFWVTFASVSKLAAVSRFYHRLIDYSLFLINQAHEISPNRWNSNYPSLFEDAVLSSCWPNCARFWPCDPSVLGTLKEMRVTDRKKLAKERFKSILALQWLKLSHAGIAIERLDFSWYWMGTSRWDNASRVSILALV
jgi:hypothetical protein